MEPAPTFSAWQSAPSTSQHVRLRLFCLPYAGGNASIFHGWEQRIAADVAVVPVQLPGRDSRFKEALCRHMEQLIPALAQSLLPDLDRPFAFFGHSMGALTSFELSRYLRQHYGQQPSHLFVSAHRAPQIPNPDSGAYSLPEAAFVERLRKLNGTPEHILSNPDLMQLLMPILRADFSICGSYRYLEDAPLDCPITVFGGSRDPLTRREQLTGWSEQTTASCTHCTIPGDHFFLHSAQPLLLWTIDQELQRILHGVNQLALQSC
jgi:medium-chain acyl-[acyl-carrier-protein] hydrolase